jgi:hypothetical protein
MKVLALNAQYPKDEQGNRKENERTGVFTTGIVCTGDGHQIALYFTGHKHAGENLADVLAKRSAGLDPPIQMCDALSRNTSGGDKKIETLLANCLSHGRRNFVNVAHNFPDECQSVLETLGEVYLHDDQARKQEMSVEERLRYHQEKSGPLMTKLRDEIKRQLDEHEVEDNSGLGKAYNYMLKHWDKLTLFLMVAGAPLDNNICERAIKYAILHRKNAMFYRTSNGARVGDLFMTMIHTAELNGVNPFDYLMALDQHIKIASENPADWMPWNYADTLSKIVSEPSPAN